MITILKNNIITDKLVFEAKDGDTPVGSVCRKARNAVHNAC